MTLQHMPTERLEAAERTPMTCREKVLAAALWKLCKDAPLQITQADMEACRDSFAPEPWTLLILDTPDGVEVRVTTGHDARMRRAYADSMTGGA
ncbi:MAG TPA: hypothetical protein VFL86_18895 [Burkholderiaceae bacterium]|nr:hypothetical protein [Burkholderiaceae bacterium]